MTVCKTKTRLYVNIVEQKKKVLLLLSVHQENLIRRVKECWDAIVHDHIFTDMTVEESQERCKLLDQCAINLQLDDPMAQYINSITREQRSFKR